MLEGLEAALEAVQNERLGSHFRFLSQADDMRFKPPLDELDDMGYSLAIRDCERAIINLINQVK